MADEDAVVICVDWAKRAVNSVMVPCSECNKPLAMSRQVRKELFGAKAVCLGCAKARGALDEEILLPTSARKEVIARLGFDPGSEAPFSLKEWARRTASGVPPAEEGGSR